MSAPLPHAKYSITSRQTFHCLTPKTGFLDCTPLAPRRLYSTAPPLYPPRPPHVRSRLRSRRPGRLLPPAFHSFTSVEFDSSRGFPGEGPNDGSQVQVRESLGRFGKREAPEAESVTPECIPPCSRTPAKSASKPRFVYTLGWLLGTLMPGTVMSSVEFLDEAGCEFVVAKLQQQRAVARFWRNRSERKSSIPLQEFGRPRAAEPSMQGLAQYQRVRRICRDLYCVLADRPEADQALAINELIETYMTRGVRLRMRTMTYAEREGFVAVRSAVHKLRTEYWTPANWLELRLCKYIAMGVFRLGGKLFSKEQDTDGSWRTQVLLPRPSNMHRAR